MKLFWDMPSMVKGKILVNLTALQMKITMSKVLPMKEEIKTNLQEADFETPETMDVDEEEVEESLPWKQKFKNLDEVVNEKNYDELPQQKKFQRTEETKDKKFHIKYTTSKPVNQLNKTRSQNILKHALGP